MCTAAIFIELVVICLVNENAQRLSTKALYSSSYSKTQLETFDKLVCLELYLPLSAV